MSVRKHRVVMSVLALFAGLSLLVLASGCEDNVDESIGVHTVIPKTLPENIPSVGVAVCSFCHERQIEQWLSGQHANLHNPYYMPPPADPLDAVGFPDYEYFYDGDTLATAGGRYCAECHDELGDGWNLEPGVTGNAPRPVVSCESCHGGGASHYGAGEIPYPEPGAAQCGKCHDSSFDHVYYHPNADDIYEEYSESPHSRSINDHVFDRNAPEEVRARCSRCHTDEGFRKYAKLVPGSTGHDSLVAYFEHVPNLTEYSDITCRTCHDAHEAKEGELERMEATVVNGNTQSRQFNTCTSCHQLVNDQGEVLTADTVLMNGSTVLNGDSFAYHDPKINPYGSLDEVITDTHAAVPGDTRLNTGPNAKRLYFVKKGDEHACAVCHNPHSADASINKQYAQSGHGDPLGEAWVHYDWKHPSRAACQRCHTTTGFINYANALRDGTVYDPANNDFSHLLGNDTVTRIDDNDQKETLYCYGCHAVNEGPHTGELSYKGKLRNPGPITAEYPAMDGSTVTYPDLNGSNVCMACHTGRESGGSIANSSSDFSNLNFINSHYLTAGSIIFRVGGYEFAESLGGATLRDYSNKPYYKHDIIGLPAAGSTVNAQAGEQGPCAGCHVISNPESHLFMPVSHQGDTITAITSTACATCHTGQYEMTPEKLQQEEEEFEASLEALEYQLALDGFWFNNCYPYFYNTQADAAACNYGARVTDWAKGNGNDWGKNNMGAAFNLNLLEHDPGAFVHNRYYVKRLIYDAIDWLDDNNMNYSVYATLNALDPVQHPYRDEAMEYLLADTTGTSADRP